MDLLRRFVCAGLVSVAAATAVFAADASVTGTWAVSTETPRGTREASMVLTQKGSDVTGTFKGQRGDSPISGTVKGNAINLSYKLSMQGNEMEIKYTGTVDGAAMTGTVGMGQMGEGKFTARKQ